MIGVGWIAGGAGLTGAVLAGLVVHGLDASKISRLEVAAAELRAGTAIATLQGKLDAEKERQANEAELAQRRQALDREADALRRAGANRRVCGATVPARADPGGTAGSGQGGPGEDGPRIAAVEILRELAEESARHADEYGALVLSCQRAGRIATP